MTKTTEINELLYITSDQYETDCQDRYLRWCLSRSKDMGQDLQQLLANTSISKYYNIEFAKIEQSFIEIVGPQKGILNYKTVRAIYSTMIIEIFNKYPQPLFEAARKLNVYAN